MFGLFYFLTFPSAFFYFVGFESVAARGRTVDVFAVWLSRGRALSDLETRVQDFLFFCVYVALCFVAA